MRGFRVQHPQAFWTAVLVFATNVAAVEVARFFADSTVTTIIATLVCSLFAALAVYAKVRLAEVKKAQD